MTECLLELHEIVYRGTLRNWGKTRKALRPVHNPERSQQMMSGCAGQGSRHSTPDDFIFPNRLRKGGFINPQNYRRKMRTLGENLGLPKLTFQVIRRTIATLGQKKRDTHGHPERIAALAAIDHH